MAMATGKPGQIPLGVVWDPEDGSEASNVSASQLPPCPEHSGSLGGLEEIGHCSLVSPALLSLSLSL